MHGNIKVLLILVAMLISIAAGEVAILVLCLALSACVDEMRFQVMFKERRQLTGIIEGLQGQLTGIIEGLQLLSRAQTNELKKLQGQNQQLRNEINEQTGKIVALREMSQQVKDEVNAQMGEIVALQQLNKKQTDEIKRQTSEIDTLQELNEEQTDEIIELRRQKDRNAALAAVLTILGIVISIICCVVM